MIVGALAVIAVIVGIAFMTFHEQWEEIEALKKQRDEAVTRATSIKCELEDLWRHDIPPHRHHAAGASVGAVTTTGTSTTGIAAG